MTYAPGSSSGKSGKFSQHQGFECAYIESGELTFHHMFDTWTLHPGDTVTFDASEPHRLENLGTEDVRAVWVILREAASSVGRRCRPRSRSGAEGLVATAGAPFPPSSAAPSPFTGRFAARAASPCLPGHPGRRPSGPDPPVGGAAQGLRRQVDITDDDCPPNG